MTGSRYFNALLAALIATGSAATAFGEDGAKKGPGPERDEECDVCHVGLGEEEAPKLDMGLYRASAHGNEGCIGCHPDVEDEEIAHEEKDQDLAPVDCGSCHEESAKVFSSSSHADLAAAKRAGIEPATCAACHGIHDILPTKNPRARVHPLMQVETCGTCHDKHRTAAGHRFEIPELYQQVVETGDRERIDALMEDHELVKAACSDCHGDHDMLPSTVPGSTLYPDRATETCGTCHEDERDEYEISAHAAAARKEGFGWQMLAPLTESDGPTKPPTCPTCHDMHGASTPETADFRYRLVAECGNCHEKLYDSYLHSYHGKATLLGSSAVAKCSDCHGYHDIRGIDDPKSRIAGPNKLEGCRTCHERAPEKFGSFWAHADPHDQDNFPVLYWVYFFMNGLLISVFSFFGLHTLMWAVRDAIEAVRAGRYRVVHDQSGPRVSRFNRFDRILHLFVIVSFLGLAATGAPMKFAQASWAPGVLDLMGGVRGAGLIHRILAVVTFGYFVAHVGSVWVRLWRFKKQGILRSMLLGPDSLVPRWSDLTDIIGSFKWFVGLGPQPTWERWTYWEKFDYWAVFWGVAIIGSSGLVLWLPSLFTHVIPGWLVNVALIVHSDEALLAIGFIFCVHFFNGHLRRAKFPMDDVIFTGSVPESEYKEERGREWARIVADGRVDQRRAGISPHPRLVLAARILGSIAWPTGLIILAFIVHGFLTT